MKLINYIEKENDNGFRKGTATIEVFGKTYELPYYQFREDHLTVNGLAGMYQTGSKVWSCSANYWFEKKNFSALECPLDHRGGRRSIRFVGIYSEVSTERNSSRHSGRTSFHEALAR